MFKKLINLIIYFIIQAVSFFIGFLSFDNAASFCGKILKCIGKYHKTTRVAYNNLKLIYPEKSDDEIHQIITNLWEHLGRNLGEFLKINSLSDDEILSRVNYSELEKLSEYIKKHPKVIIVSGHFGNWEIAPRVASILNMPFSLIYRKANNNLVDKKINSIRKKYVTNLFNKGQDGIRSLIREIKNNDKFILCMLIDQKMTNGILCDFLGQPALTSTVAADLAIKFKMPLIMAKIERIGMTSNFKIRIEPFIDDFLEQSNLDERELLVRKLTEQMNDEISSWVRDKPYQWFWIHRRWKK